MAERLAADTVKIWCEACDGKGGRTRSWTTPSTAHIGPRQRDYRGTEPGHSPTAYEARDDLLRAIAQCARGQGAGRWLIVGAAGDCSVGDDTAASVGGHRTLIELG